MDATYPASTQPRFAPGITEDLLLGDSRLRSAFIGTTTKFAGRSSPLISPDDRNGPVILIRNGVAFRSFGLADGRRAILHIVLPGDLVGLEHVVLHRPAEEIIAAGRVSFAALPASRIRELMKDHCITLAIMAQVAETWFRADRLAASLGRLDAEARLCVMLLDLHDRLRHARLISRPTFNVPLTQEQIADHIGMTLVHVNRTLRRLRDEHILVMERGVAIILNLDRMRELARGLPEFARFPEPGAEPTTPGAPRLPTDSEIRIS